VMPMMESSRKNRLSRQKNASSLTKMHKTANDISVSSLFFRRSRERAFASRSYDSYS